MYPLNGGGGVMNVNKKPSDGTLSWMKKTSVDQFLPYSWPVKDLYFIRLGVCIQLHIPEIFKLGHSTLCLSICHQLSPPAIQLGQVI